MGVQPSQQRMDMDGGSSTESCGVNGCGQSGVYGTLGKAAATNIPGSRQWASSWTDANGRFWLFGGYGSDASGNQGVLNDLWEFNPTTNQWAWMGGSSTVPSSSLGAPGVYGTFGAPAPGNFPGGRYYATTWTDTNGNLWLFGGNGSDASGNPGDLNDLWEFNPTTNEWAWMSGNELLPKTALGWSGVYGSLDVASPSNAPGGRTTGLSWTDESGHLWLFGGNGYDQVGTMGNLNDLWVVVQFEISRGCIRPSCRGQTR